MATIAKLVLRIEAETRSLQTQLRQASAQVTKFTADLNRSFARIPKLNTLFAGGANVKGTLDTINRDFERAFTQLRNQAKKTLISPTALADQLRVAVQNAKNQAQSLIGALESSGQITGRKARGLLRETEQSAIRAETNILIAEAQQSLSQLESRFKSTQASLLTQRATGALQPHEFTKLGAEAEAAFNIGWSAEMARFATDPRMTDPIRVALASQFKRGGFGAGAAASVVEQSVAQAKAGASAFVQQYQKTIQSAKFGNLTGDLTGKQFQKVLADANKQLGAGLKTVRDTLDKQGLLTPEALKFLNSQFARAGQTTASGFFESFDKAMSEGSIRSLQRFGTVVSQVGGTLAKFLTVPLLAAAGASVKLAGDAEQANRKLESTFGPFAVDLSRKLAGLRKDIPATSAELTNMAATFGELLIPLRLAPQEVAKMSVELIKAAKNVSVFRGVSTERGFNAIVNALVGQSRELKKLGIEIDDRTIRDEAYRTGLARVGAQLSTTQKVMAGYSVIMQRTGLVQNTLQDQQNTFNVRMLFFTASVKEAGIALGSVLLPSITRLVVHATSLADRFSLLSGTGKTMVFVFGAIAAAIGPALIALGFLVRTIAVVRASYLSISALTGQTGLAALLGISASTVVEILGVTAVIAGLVAEIMRYKDMMNTTTSVSDDFVRSIRGMTTAELAHAAVQRDLELGRLNQRIARLKQAAGIEVLQGAAGPIISGGTVRDRQEFESLGNAVTVVKKEIGLIRDEMGSVETAQARVNKEAAEWEKRIKASQDLANSDLLVENLARAKSELQEMNREAADAKRTIGAGIKLRDTEMITRGTELAQKALGELGSAVENFNRQSREPDNAQISVKLQGYARDAQAAADSLKAFLATTANTRVLATFGAQLAEIRKELQLGGKTNNTVMLTDAFGKMATLGEDVQQAITKAQLAGDEATAARLRTIKLTLAELRLNFERMVPAEFFKSIDQSVEQLKLLKEQAAEGTITSTGIPLEDFHRANVEVEKLVVANDELNRQIARRKELAQPYDDLLKKQVEIQKAINAATPNLFDLLFGENFIPRINTVTAALRQATSGEDAAKLAGNQSLAVQAHLEVIRAQADLGRLTADFLKAIQGLSPDQQKAAIIGFVAAFKLAGGEASDFSEHVDKSNKRLLRMGAVVGVLRQVAEVFGVMDKNVGKAIQSTGALIENLLLFRRAQASFETRAATEKARTGATVGMNFEELTASLTSAIGIVVNVFTTMEAIGNAIFGLSETEREHMQILQDNNRHLDEMRLALQGFTGAIGQQLTAAQAIARPDVIQAAQRFSSETSLERVGLLPQGTALRDFNLVLAKSGLSLAALQKIAEQNGINILDSKGRLVADAFNQLVQAIEISRKTFFVWADTLDDQSKRIELFNNVFNVPDTGQQAVQDQLTLLDQLAPDLFKQFFAGVDLSDMTAVEAALQAFTQALLDGSLEASDSLKLLNKDEVIRIITDMANGFDKLREATDKMTESALNVPTWFKRAQFTFESAAAVMKPPIDRTPTTLPTTPTVGGPDNPTPPLGPRQAVDSVSAATLAAAKMSAATLDVARMTAPALTVTAQVADVPPLTVDARDLPSLTVTVPQMPVLQLDVPDIQPLRVDIPDIPAPELTLPDIPALTVDASDLPTIELSVPEIPALDVVIPAIPTLTLVVPDLPKLTVDVPSLPTLQVAVPDVPPVVVQVADIPPVPLVVPDIPPVTVRVADIPPVAVTVPPLVLTVPKLPALQVAVPELPALALAVPDIPALDVRMPGLPQLDMLRISDMIANQLTVGTTNVPAIDAPAPPPTAPLAAAERPLGPTTNVADVGDTGPASAGGDITVNGPLIGSINQQPGESTDDFVDRLVATLRRRQFLATGTSSLKGFV
jgi:hypothetical protein